MCITQKSFVNIGLLWNKLWMKNRLDYPLTPSSGRWLKCFVKPPFASWCVCVCVLLQLKWLDVFHLPLQCSLSLQCQCRAVFVESAVLNLQCSDFHLSTISRQLDIKEVCVFIIILDRY